MESEMMTIGDVARRSGLTVKTVRFYSDHGLLPPSGRSESGYRLYSAGDLVRLETIRTLRDAGLDVATVRGVLRRELTLGEALSLRLHAVEAHIASLQQVAAALRATLTGDADEHDLRRLQAVTQLTNEDRRAQIERFFEQVSEGTRIDEQWTRDMIEASAPRLPDEPTREQLDAWIELAGIVSDAGFIESMRSTASKAWSGDTDMQASTKASEDAVAAARTAIDAGRPPQSEEAGTIVNDLVAGLAAANGRPADAAFRRELADQFASHDPRAMRYWELVAVINGAAEIASRTEEWAWLSEALVHHLGGTRLHAGSTPLWIAEEG